MRFPKKKYEEFWDWESDQMLIIGITGGTGSGKSTALQALRELGALALDCDAIYHELLENNAELVSEISNRFNDVLTGSKIDRKKLGESVFNDHAALLDLNTITHKYVKKEVDRRITEWDLQGGRITGIDAVALIESGQNNKCSLTVGITAPAETRIKRIMERDGISREQAESRSKAQKPDGFYKDNCDYILENTAETPDEFKEICKTYFTGIIGGERNA